jgi:hypothetical protein
LQVLVGAGGKRVLPRQDSRADLLQDRLDLALEDSDLFFQPRDF